jgi:hypothetical protein
MIDEPDPPLDLSPLAADRDLRAARMSARVLDQVTAFRRQQAQRDEVREGVRRRLARFALPGALAAVISFLAILATGTRETPRPEAGRFAMMVMGQTPAARWIALDQPPGIEELLQAMGGR